MIKVKILKAFRDLKLDKVCEIGQVEEFSKERLQEIKFKLGEDFIEEIKEEIKEEKKVVSKPKKAK